MASIRTRVAKDGTPTYSVLFRHDGKQSSLPCEDLPSASRIADRMTRLGVEHTLRTLSTRTEREAENMPTLVQQVAAHIEGLSGVQEDTLENYRRKVRQLAETEIGNLPVDVITRDDVAAWVRDRQRPPKGQKVGEASKTTRNHHSLISAALKRAMEDGLIDRNVAAGIRIARTERAEMVILDPTEFARLFAKVPGHYRPFVMTLYGTGLRLSEATALQVGDLHLDHTPATLTVARAHKKGGGTGAPKTRAGRRTIAVPAPVVVELRKLAKGKKPSDLVFVNNRGERIRQNTLWESWSAWVKAADLGKTPRLHDLRHSHASYLISAGMNLYDVMRRLGHNSITTTADTYGHMMPDAQVQAERAASLAFVTLPEPTQIAN